MKLLNGLKLTRLVSSEKIENWKRNCQKITPDKNLFFEYVLF